MRSFLILAIVSVLIGCANGGEHPEYCRRPFDWSDKRFDLDHDGIVAGSDIVIYRKKCLE